MDEQKIQEIVREEIQRMLGDTFKVGFHVHNGLDAPLIDSKNIIVRVLNQQPQTIGLKAPNGSIVASEVSGTRRLHVIINGVWYSVTVT